LFRVRRGSAIRLSLALGLATGWLSPPSASAASLVSNIKLDADDTNRPMVLDQNGQWIHPLDNKITSSGATASGSVPTYVGYQVDSDDSLPAGLPTIQAGPRVPGQTVGPLHLDASVQAQLNTALAQYGGAAVHTGNDTILVKPVSSLAGDVTAGKTTSLSAWLAGQAASTTSGTAGSSQPQAQNLAQMLNLNNITKPITDAQLIKDLNHLLTLKSGKLVNWNQQTFNALKHDLKLSAPKNVTPATTTSLPGSTTTASSGTVAAQMLNGPGNTPSSGATTAMEVLPAPVPEPSTWVIFSLAAGALALRKRLGCWNPG
jgi:hypothetical protein